MNRRRILLAGRPSRTRGVSLVELMVGLAVGMLLVAGLALLFANSSQSNRELDKSVRHIENGRYAVEVLSQEIALAGFYADVPSTTAGNPIAACADATDLAGSLNTMRVASPLQVPPGLQGLAPSEAAALACLANHKADTPALVVRRLDTVAVAPAITTDMHNRIYVQTSNFANDNVTSYVSAIASASTTSGNTFTLRNIKGDTNTIRRFISRIYYIASCNECGRDTVPTLKMLEVTGSSPTAYTTFALAEGIDTLGLDYGIDSDNDGNADEWFGSTGANLASYMAARGWGNVVAVRVSLVSRAAEASTGWDDTSAYAAGLECTPGVSPALPTCTSASYTPPSAQRTFKRRGYVTTVRLQSWAGLREK